MNTCDYLSLSFVAAALLAMAAPAPGAETGDDFAQRCADLNYVSLERAADSPGRIVTTSVVRSRVATDAERTMFVKRGHSQGNPTPALETYPDHCRVEGYVTPHVQFVLMLPTSEAYNGNFMLAACDAWCGAINDDSLVPGLHRGYATLTNNGGHYSRAPFDGIWAYNDVTARENFAYRANHVTAQAARAIIDAFYGELPKYSYITGFSKGGNAGLFAVQKYPEDFDGVFVKAPVVDYQAKNAAHFTWLALAVYPDGKTPVLHADKIPLIRDAVLSACDDLDGLRDGIINDPRECDFDPAVLACDTVDSDHQCLTAEQVTAVEKIYAKPTGADGRPYFEYPTDYGSETNWAAAILPVPGRPDPSFALDGARTGLRYMVFETSPGPDYDWTRFDYPKEKAKLEPMARILDPNEIDLSEFRDRGGKLIVVHGWSDGMVSASMTIDWLERVHEAMGGREAVSEFAQLYVVPGMHHGSGGPAPFEYDAQSALERWVEEGTAPERLIMHDEAGTEPYRTRPSFPYPDVARYSGDGNPNDAASFVRETPDE